MSRKYYYDLADIGVHSTPVYFLITELAPRVKKHAPYVRIYYDLVLLFLWFILLYE